MIITAVILAGALTLTQGTATGSIAALESEADAALKTDTPTFDQRAALVDRIDRARGTSSGETAARLALLWLRGVKWMFSSIPLAQRDGEPHNAWIRAHQDLVAWSEPAGEWILAVTSSGSCTTSTATRRSRSRSRGSPSRTDCRGSARATSRATRSA